MNKKAEKHNEGQTLELSEQETDKWTQIRLWTLLQSAFLLSGLNPDAFPSSKFGEARNAISMKCPPVLPIWEDWYGKLKDGVDLYDLDRNHEYGLAHLGSRTLAIAATRVEPKSLFQWLVRNGYAIPTWMDTAFASERETAERITDRERQTLLNIIGALLDIMLKKTSAGTPHSVFQDEDKIMDAIVAHHKGKYGLSKSNLQRKFPAAKRSLNSQ